MERLKTPRGILKHPPLGALPVPITLDPEANRGSIVRGEDGKLYASQANDGVTYNWAPLTSDAFVDTAGSISILTIWVKEGEPSPTDAEMLVTPPIIKENAVGTIDAAARFANIAALGTDTRVIVNIGAGLYNPASSWSNPTHVVAWDKDLVSKKHLAVTEEGPADLLAQAVSLSLIGGNLALDGDGDHSFYPGQALGYMDLDDYPHFIPYSSVELSNNIAGVVTRFNEITIRNSFVFEGGFHFIAFEDYLRLIAQYYDGLHPTRADLLDLATVVYDLPEAAFSTAANNADIFFAAQRVAYSTATATSLGGLTAGPAISILAPAGSGVLIHDCSFGAMPPTDLTKGGGLREGYINIETPCFVNVANISLVGNTTVTSAGSGWNEVAQSGSPPVGTVTQAAPFTYRRHSASLITIFDASGGTSLNLGCGFNTRDPSNNARNFYYTPSEQLCPNNWYALDNNGDIPSDDDSGPFVNALISAPFGVILNRDQGQARGANEGVLSSLYTGDYLVNQGFVGKFGSNGFNSTLSRGILLGNNQGNIGGASFAEASFTLVLGKIAGTTACAWRKAGIPRSVINTSFNTADTSHTDPGEGSPVGANIVVTTPDANGIRLATRTWNLGVDVALATIVRTASVNGIYTL